MKNVILFLVAVATVHIVTAQTSGTKESFIPQNWKLIYEAVGDLNKDSVADIAMVIEYTETAQLDESPRLLLLLLKDKPGQLYKLAARAEHVILGSQSGGTMGDPFSDMQIKNNVLRIDFAGGSREQWSTTHRYRLTPQNYFRVIGATYTVEDGSVTSVYDYNLSNGNAIITKRSSENKAKNTTVNKKIPLRPISIERFEPDAIWALLMPDAEKKTETCILQNAGLGDCAHLIFDCGDFGNAELFLDEASYKLWESLTVSDANDEVVPNPTYKGKKYQITYVPKYGIRCEPQGKENYQLVIGIKQIP